MTMIDISPALHSADMMELAISLHASAMDAGADEPERLVAISRRKFGFVKAGQIIT